MEKSVIFRDRQELQADDMNNVQDYARASIDNVVADTISGGNAYAGFAVSKTGAAEVTLTPGRVYEAGQVFARDSEIVLDLISSLPIVAKKYVAIVGYGQLVETEVEPRDFLIDIQQGTTEPQSVAMREDRYANVAVIAGVEAPDPSYPAVDTSYTVIAYVLLETAGVDSIEQWLDTQAPNLAQVNARTRVLEAWRGQVSGQVDTLRTDLSALASRSEGFALANDLEAAKGRLAHVWDTMFAPASPLFYAVDHLLTDATSQDSHGDYDAIAAEGIRFPWDGFTQGAISLLNPNDVRVTKSADLILPKFAHSLRLDLPGYDAEERLSTYSFETVDYVEKTMTRQRVRYGASRIVCTNAAWWTTGSYDPVSRIFSRNGETFTVEDTDMYHHWSQGRQKFYRLRQFWLDHYEEPYWTAVTNTTNVSGQQVAQTWLNAQDGWLSQVGLYFTRRAGSGDVTVLICETAHGMPDLTKVISTTTLAHGDIAVGADSGGAGLPSVVETKVPLRPTYLRAGRRYAAVLITAADHYVAMTSTDNAIVQGTFFASTDGAFFAGNLVSDMKMRLYYAEFERTRVSVEMSSLSLAGGISDIDILTASIVPPACDLDIEVQVSGAWVPLAPDPDGPNLTGLPDILPMRLTFTGTTDLMPAVDLAVTEATVSRNKTAAVWIGDQRVLPSTAGTVKVVADLFGYDEAEHDCTISLMTGVGQTGDEAADVVEDVTLQDGTIRRTATFSGLTADYYTVKIVASTTSAQNVFIVSELIDYAIT